MRTICWRVASQWTAKSLLLSLLGLAGAAHAAEIRDISQAGLARLETSPGLGLYVDKPGVPPGTQVVVETDKAEYFLGENVLLHFGLRNNFGRADQVRDGGDYRGVPSTQFQVTARDAEGRELLADQPRQLQHGRPDRSLCGQARGNLVGSIPLMRYRTFDQPGEYTIRVQHDLGWAVPMDQMPAGEKRIRFVMPTAAQAEAIVAGVAALKVEDRRDFGKKLAPSPDFSTLHRLSPGTGRARPCRQCGGTRRDRRHRHA